MRASLPHLTGLVSSFLLLATIVSSESPEIPRDEPRLYANVSLNTDTQGFPTVESPDLNLAARQYVCSTGYSECTYNSMKCCPSSSTCCGNGYCADPGETCCSTGGTCSSGSKCCAGSRGCAPVGAECCSDGTYCRAGKECRTYRGRKTCCAPSGCIGENDSGGDDVGVTAPTLTQTATVTSAYRAADWEYYSTTIYWTYYYYFWTSYTPYTVKTVTSTRTSTKTVWSVYATNSREARSELSSSSRSYTFSAPYSATSLKSSTRPVTISAGSAAPTSTSSNTGDNTGRLVSGSGDIGLFPDSAAGRSVSGTGVIAAVLVAAIGGLAFGL